MKIHDSTLTTIRSAFNKKFVIQTYGNNSLLFRFGYWDKIDYQLLNNIIVIHENDMYIKVTEQVEYDEDCGDKYSYCITKDINLNK